MKRKREESPLRWTENFEQPWPVEILTLCTDNFCRVCNIEINGPSIAKSHYNGKNHEKEMKKKFLELFGEEAEPPQKKLSAIVVAPVNLESLGALDKSGISVKSGIYWCDLCSFKCGENDTSLKNHTNGASHKKRVKIQIHGVDPSGQNMLCDVCMLQVNRTQLDAHLNGKAHKKMLARGRTLIYCETCKLHFSGEVSYNQHMQGKKHAEALTGSNFCKVCKLDLETEEAYALHALGDAHKAEVEKKGEAVNKPKIIDYNNL